MFCLLWRTEQSQLVSGLSVPSVCFPFSSLMFYAVELLLKGRLTLLSPQAVHTLLRRKGMGFAFPR